LLDPFQPIAAIATTQIDVQQLQPLVHPQSDRAYPPGIDWHSHRLWVGIGCGRNTPKAVIEHAVQQVFQKHHLAEGAIAGIATVDLKANEPGIIEFCHERNLPRRCFPAAALQSTPVPNPSSIVHTKIGIPSVAEAAAILAAHPELSTQHLELNTSLTPQSPFPNPQLLIPKQIFRLDNYPGAVTIAVAQEAPALTPKRPYLQVSG